MKVGLAVAMVVDDEETILAELRRAGERHAADHDVLHMSHTLAALHRGNLERLAPFADGEPDEHGDGLLGRAREAASRLASRREETGLLLLRDLRALHLLYAEASIDYVLLGQGAQAARDAALLDACSRNHTQTLRGLRWTVTRLKAAAPQVLSG